MLRCAEGVVCAKKDYRIRKHPECEASNLEVIKLCTSLKSRGLVHEIFSWQWYYWSLTDEGIEYLRDFLHLPADEVPNTLKKPTKDPLRRPGAEDDRRDRGDRPRPGDRDGRGERREGGEYVRAALVHPRRGVADADGPGPAPIRLRSVALAVVVVAALAAEAVALDVARAVALAAAAVAADRRRHRERARGARVWGIESRGSLAPRPRRALTRCSAAGLLLELGQPHRSGLAGLAEVSAIRGNV